MNFAHTPGPWEWWGSNSFMRLTAFRRQDGGVLSAHCPNCSFATVVVSEADARLIAAAPELFERLEQVYQELKNPAGHNLGYTLAAIEGALKKVTGGVR